MNSKKYLIIALAIMAVLAAGFFGWRYFSKAAPKAIKINEETVQNNDSNAFGSSTSKSEELGSIDQNTNTREENKKMPDNIPPPSDKLNIIDRLVSWGFQKASGRKIDTIIIHSTYNALGGYPFSPDKIIGIYKSYGVSPHYIIDRAGNIYCLVADENIAYHAGVSQMPDGRTNVNNFSLGIELINTKTDRFTSAQYNSLNSLLKYLHGLYPIKYVLGHNQIAPGRKTDPWNIDWSKVNK